MLISSFSGSSPRIYEIFFDIGLKAVKKIKSEKGNGFPSHNRLLLHEQNVIDDNKFARLCTFDRLMVLGCLFFGGINSLHHILKTPELNWIKPSTLEI
jgi:hypothetical protein